MWIPLSDGCFVLDNGSTVVRQNYTGKITINRDSAGNRTIKEEPLTEEGLQRFRNLEESFPGVRSGRRNSSGPPPRPPPPRIPPTAAGAASDTTGWLTTRNRQSAPGLLRPPRWVSQSRQRPQSPPPPYQGLFVTEAPQSPPPYGEVLVEQQPQGVRGNFFLCYFFWKKYFHWCNEKSDL